MVCYSPKSNELNKSLLQILSQDVHIDAPCGGNGSCGKCLIWAKGNLSEPSDTEKKILGDKIKDGYRLACMTFVSGDFYYKKQSEIKTEIQSEFTGSLAKTEFDCGYGLAVDVGTTTVALYLIDLPKGEIIKTDSFKNPQSSHGADVISRISFAMQGGAKTLYDEITTKIKERVDSLGDYNITRTVVCANTVMEHFLTLEDASGLAALPFLPSSLFGKKYALPFSDNCYIAPCIGGYVGGDITVGAVGADIDRKIKPALYIDIGTNGEIVLNANKKIYSCATAAGPAFEGANIECGCMAVAGAICRVYGEDGELKFETVGNAEPIGICGSGLIDCVCAMLECGMLSESGRMNCERYYFGNGVYISQKDIRNIQLAKAAISAGVGVLCDKAGIEYGELDEVIIAGGFGSHIRVESAVKIGLIPNVEKTASIGNSAGHGAVNCTLSDSEIKRVEEFAKNTEYIELSGNKKFNELYTEEMFFEEKE